MIDIKELEQTYNWKEFKEQLRAFLGHCGLNSSLIDDALNHLKPFVDVFASELIILKGPEVDSLKLENGEQCANKEFKSIVQDIKQQIDNDLSDLLLALIRLLNVIASK